MISVMVPFIFSCEKIKSGNKRVINSIFFILFARNLDLRPMDKEPFYYVLYGAEFHSLIIKIF